MKKRMALLTRQSIRPGQGISQGTVQRTALGLAISLVMTYPIALQALGLGELHSSSQLNQPLNAQIDLLSTTSAEARQLQVKLASPDVFSRVGIDRPSFLNNLTFTPTVQNGKPVIRVTSSTPISEPFLNFLLEVSWPQGQLLKEYTVLLDPPVLMNAGSAATENAVAVRAEPQSSGVVQRNQEAERQRAQQQRQQQLQIQRQQAQLQQQQAEEARRIAAQRQFEAQARAVINEPDAAPARSLNTSSKYRVKRGDTVSRIASRLRYRGVSNNQMMLALFRANPKAFSQDNINNLKTGALLSRPAKSEVTSHSSSEAKKIIRQHYAQWKKYRSGLAGNTVAQQSSSTQTSSQETKGTSVPNAGTQDSSQYGTLTVAGNDTKGQPSSQVSAAGSAEIQKQITLYQEAIASGKSENAELRARVSKLEEIIRKKNRLINLKNNKLADLEARLGGAVPSEVDTANDIATQVGNNDKENSGGIIRGGSPEEAVTNEGDAKEGITDSEALAQTDTGDKPNPDAQSTENQPADDKDINRLAVADPDPVLDPKVDDPFVNDDKKSTGGILELLSSPLVAAIGGGGLLALLLGWFLMRRSSTSIETNDDFMEDPDGVDDSDDFFDDENSSLESDLNDFTSESSVSSEATDVENLFSDDKSDSMDSILSGDDSLEDDDVLQEVDVYIVYGLHEQAEDELNKAIAKNPSKMEYRYKLLENYKAADDAESFVSSAKDFLNAEGDNKEELWDKIVIWGKEIAPENELFADSSLKSAMGMVAGAVGLGAAATVAKEAFNDDALADTDALSNEDFSSTDSFLTDSDTHVVDDSSTTDDFADIVLPQLDDEDDSDIASLTDGFDLSDELDLGDDFGLDALADKDFDTTDSNVIDFGIPDTSNDITGVDLDINNKDVDKILSDGSGYLSSDNNDTVIDSDDGLGDALSFLDISDDDEEMQDAHIGTKLDLARAYLDMGDVEGARHTLEEVVIEGNDDQKKEAEELLQQTG